MVDVRTNQKPAFNGASEMSPWSEHVTGSMATTWHKHPTLPLSQGCRKLRPSRPPVSDKVKVGRTNHVGQERSKGHLTHIKETHKDCHMNLGQYFKIGHWLDNYGWTNCSVLDNCPKVLYHWKYLSQVKSRLVGQIIWDKKDIIGHIVNIKDI